MNNKEWYIKLLSAWTDKPKVYYRKIAKENLHKMFEFYRDTYPLKSKLWHKFRQTAYDISQ